MLQAVEAPLSRTMVITGVGAALALGLALLPAHHRAHPVVHRLVLDAPIQPHALYLTAWESGDVYVTFDKDVARSMTFTTRAHISDGCFWQATETLVPLTDTKYSYSYDETILSCEDGAVPALKTPRTGFVFVVE